MIKHPQAPKVEQSILTDAEIDQHLAAILKAGGSALKHYSPPKSLVDMRAAVKAVAMHAVAKAINTTAH